ncbi:unnamed protein product [Lactuca virosa]|uniref:F-box domain-containing protein n=1 Tax=Lactuca virosa TaxID=75947 RepID=A0AAU9NCH4_9ASTR|nr:unnamed protein product [Lactuca virosa]
MASLNLGPPIPIKTNLYNVLSISDPSCSKLAGDPFVNSIPSIMHPSGLSPPDLTIKVFSMLDTPSVCSASATCLFFQNCAKDPMCFANIDLAIPKVNVGVVTTMIQRARNALQSIKLVELPPDPAAELLLNKQTKQGKKSSILKSSFLGSLSANGGAHGSHLRRLHLHNIKMMDNISLFASLSVCPSLVDLEVVGLDVNVSPTLEFVSRHCCLIERFVFDHLKSKDSVGGAFRMLERHLFDDEGDFIENSACKEFVLNCPKITTLALKGWFHRLKYVDFSTSCFFSGSFLNTLGSKGDGNSLEVMILRNCSRLKKVEVKKLMKSLLAGKFRLLRHLVCIAYNDHLEDRHYGVSSILIKQLLEQRPNFCFVPEFPKLNLVNHMTDDLSSPTSDASSSTSTSTSSDASSSTSTTSDSSSSTSTSSSS